MGASQAGHRRPDGTKRAVTLWIAQASLGVPAYGLMLYLTSGDIGWLWGWVLLGITAVGMASHVVLLMPINPELLAERNRGLLDPRARGWDRWVTLSASVGMLGAWVVAGLDRRWGWSLPYPLAVHLAGTAAHIAGWAMFMWAMVSNAYFAETARIQADRGHTVCTGGPYRLVRHPGYVGSILLIFSSPFLLGSWWAVIPAGLGSVMFVVRTVLEDRMLTAELPGYAEYARKTRFRLMPGVW